MEPELGYASMPGKRTKCHPFGKLEDYEKNLADTKKADDNPQKQKNIASTLLNSGSKMSFPKIAFKKAIIKHKVVFISASVLLYIILFHLVYIVGGRTAFALSLIPLICAASVLGRWGGLISGPLLILLNLILLLFTGEINSTQPVCKSFWVTNGSALFIGYLVGYLCDLNAQYNNVRLVVRKIADGDLFVRAEKVRNYEIGDLAASVNVMADSLLRKDRILESIRFASHQFMISSEWETVVDSVLAKMGRAAGVSRAYIFENQKNDTGALRAYRKFEWTSEGIRPELNNPEWQNLDYDKAGIGGWRKILEKDKIINGPVKALSDDIRVILEQQDIISILIIPVFVNDAWWGFLGFDDCVNDRTWSRAEIDSLRSGADMLGATIVRQQFQRSLLEAKETLEQRVEERTRELKTQVMAKEKALTELAEAQSALVEASRAAGMAEVATGVLHNVGNVLNSVNVSCALLLDQIRESRVSNLVKVTDMLSEQQDDLTCFLTTDPKGQKIPRYLTSLASALVTEQQTMRQETEALQGRIVHIKEIVSMQQSYGNISGVNETLPPEKLMEDAVKINAGALDRHGITVQREYETVPRVTVDKHMVLQILLNLISNAKYACSDIDNGEKRVILKIRNQNGNRVQMRVEDNGVGISQENRHRIFQHGFTTKKSGHGFGLHSAAIAAQKLGGRLSVHSDGHGRGAEFTLELPCIKENLDGIPLLQTAQSHSCA
jgi:signal transduction histidine kinase